MVVGCRFIPHSCLHPVPTYKQARHTTLVFLYTTTVRGVLRKRRSTRRLSSCSIASRNKHTVTAKNRHYPDTTTIPIAVGGVSLKRSTRNEVFTFYRRTSCNTSQKNQEPASLLQPRAPRTMKKVNTALVVHREYWPDRDDLAFRKNIPTGTGPSVCKDCGT